MKSLQETLMIKGYEMKTWGLILAGTAYRTMDLSQKVELFDHLLLTENYENPSPLIRAPLA